MSTTNLSYSNLPDTAPRLPADDGAPSALVGNTPLLRIGEPFASGGSGFWAKLEGCNPGGMKDRPALHMVECARARGDLAPSARIVESTSGTLGLGLALAGTVYGHPVTLVTDPGLEPIVHNMLHAYGADVEVVSEAHPSGGWQQARRERVLELLAVHPGSWCPDQYSNPDNVAGYKSLALELLEQLDRVDVLVCSVGTGGHSAGVAQVLRQHYPDMRLVGVDAVGSTIFGQPARPRLMRGLGSSIFPANVDYDAFDEVHWLAPDEVVRACRALAATYHASGGWSVGAVALAAGWVARNSAADTHIVTIFPDGPQRYFDSIYNDDFCREHGLLNATMPTDPVTISNPADVVIDRWSRCADVTQLNGRRR